MTTMQRWELSAFGRENLSLVSVPRPIPGADEEGGSCVMRPEERGT